LLVPGVLIQRGDADRHILVEDMVVAHRVALRAIAVRLGADPAAVGEEVGLDGGAVHDAARAAEAEEGGIGAALHFDAVGVERVEGDAGDEVVPGEVGGGQTADAGDAAALVVALLFGNRITRALGGGIIAAQAADFRVGRQDQHVLDVGGAGVPEELFVDDRDRGADIPEVRAETGAGEGGGCLITDVAVVGDNEGRQHEGVFLGFLGGLSRGGDGLRKDAPRE
jgi:hypothetical protein